MKDINEIPKIFGRECPKECGGPAVNCGGALVTVTTTNNRLCSNGKCGQDQPCDRDEGQKPLVGSNRIK